MKRRRCKLACVSLLFASVLCGDKGNRPQSKRKIPKKTYNRCKADMSWIRKRSQSFAFRNKPKQISTLRNDDAKKADDGRISSGKYIEKMNKRKSLPIGISDSVRAWSEYHYADKTMLINKFSDKKSLASLFTSLFIKPKRFGKTLNIMNEK